MGFLRVHDRGIAKAKAVPFETRVWRHSGQVSHLLPSASDVKDVRATGEAEVLTAAPQVAKMFQLSRFGCRTRKSKDWYACRPYCGRWFHLRRPAETRALFRTSGTSEVSIRLSVPPHTRRIESH